MVVTGVGEQHLQMHARTRTPMHPPPPPHNVNQAPIKKDSDIARPTSGLFAKLCACLLLSPVLLHVGVVEHTHRLPVIITLHNNEACPLK